MVKASSICHYLNFLFWNKDTSVAQFFIGLASMFWAIMLFWPGDTFERQTYWLMAEMMVEHAWALFFLMNGFFMIIMSTRVWILNFWIEITWTTISCVLWSASCIAMLLAVYPPPAAISAEISLALAAWWVLVRTDYPGCKERGR